MRYVILHNIRSAHNVGSIFRTADGAGVEKIFLTGYTPAPTDRFGRGQPEIAKTSLGASATVSWEQVANVDAVVSALRAAGAEIVAVEQCPGAVDYTRYKPKESTAYIFGNEVEGISLKMCEAADAAIHIPMAGKKESLNVSVAAGIILFCMQT